MTSSSAVSRAIGVTSFSVTLAWLVAMAPTITRPMTMSELSLRSLASWARPTVPPAPSTFLTVTDFASLPDSNAAPMARAVPSQPPPGAAGAMMSRREKGFTAPSSLLLPAFVFVDPEPQAASATATTAVSAMARSRRVRRGNGPADDEDVGT
jgi:hypothetical protein